jgi:hypothetical protein
MFGIFRQGMFGCSGKIKVRRNRLNWSEDATNAAWAKGTVTATQTGTTPFGTAYQKIADSSTANTNHQIVQTLSAAFPVGTVFLFKAFAKAAEYPKVTIYSIGAHGTNPSVRFDLSNGTAANFNSATSTIVDMGSGWYECTMTVPATTLAVAPQLLFRITLSDNSVSYAGTVGNGVFFGGAHVQDASLSNQNYQRIDAGPGPV